MAKDKEEADTWFKIGFEDEAWKEEKTNAAFQTMSEQMREEKKEEAKHKRNERELSDWRGYYSLVMAANIVAGLDESTTLRTSLPSYPIWAKARSARERGWCVNGGLSRPREDFAIPVRQVQREEGWFVCLSDFIEWAIEAGCAVAPRAIEDARRECEVSDTFERRARLWEIERTQGELRSAKTESVEGILARDARLAELDRERGEIILSLKSDEPESGRADGASASGDASTAPSLGAGPCIRCPPTNEDDWYLIIHDAARSFIAEHKRCPENKKEMWSWMNTNPPGIYGITRGKHNGEKALLTADGGALGRRSFDSRWDRYTCRTKPHKGK